jgi:hypothetical protein
VIDGNKVIIVREELDQRVDDVTFEQGEVYSIDVAFSSGEGACARAGGAARPWNNYLEGVDVIRCEVV